MGTRRCCPSRRPERSLKQTRVFLSAASQILRDMLTDVIETQPDMKIVGNSEQTEDLVGALARTQPDVVIVSALRPLGRRSFDELLYAAPRLKVLAIIDNNRRGVLYEMRPHRSPRGEMFPESLLQAIRDAVRNAPHRRSGPQEGA